MMGIHPSILAADLSNLKQQVGAVVEAGASRIHFDVMDGRYVPNLSFGPPVLKALRRHYPDLPIDVHLMVRPVTQTLLDAFIQAGASSIVFHPETCDHVHRSLMYLDQAGVQAGLAFNPSTELSGLDYLMPYLKRILLMSVNPGFSGQPFLPAVLSKAQAAAEWIQQQATPVVLEMDGGMNPDTIAQAHQAGVTAFVVGSDLFSAPDYHQRMQQLQAAYADS